MDGRHGGKTGTDRVGSRGYSSGSAGTVLAARARRGAQPPAGPVVAANWLEHGTGSWRRGSPLPHGATALPFERFGMRIELSNRKAFEIIAIECFRGDILMVE